MLAPLPRLSASGTETFSLAQDLPGGPADLAGPLCPVQTLQSPRALCAHHTRGSLPGAASTLASDSGGSSFLFQLGSPHALELTYFPG